MAPKAKTPAPIDRPLSRAYLREFTGWSTNYPPGLSDPTSLRLMENVQVNKDGSLRVRPGLRYLSYFEPPTDVDPGVGLGFVPVGTHEAFFLNDGSKAYLFAVRENDETVGFRVLRPDVNGSVVQELTDPGIDFEIPQTEAVLNFTAATTYVKYLQVDNKIFALSDAGESMRLFAVGEQKSARKIISIEKPSWSVADKLTVVHPDSEWITNGTPLSVRTNLLKNPGFTSTANWSDFSPEPGGLLELSTTEAHSGTTSLKVTSLPTRTNVHPHPLGNVGLYGITGWFSTSNTDLTPGGSNYMNVTVDAGSKGRRGFATSSTFGGIKGGKSYRIAYDALVPADSDLTMIVRWFGSNGAQIGADRELTSALVSGRFLSVSLPAPSSAVRMSLHIGITVNTTSSRNLRIKNLVVAESTESTAFFSGDSGSNYFWLGDPEESISVYHPPVQVGVVSEKVPIAALASLASSIYVKSGADVTPFVVGIQWYNTDGTPVGSVISAPADTTTAWVRRNKISAAPAGATHGAAYLVFGNLSRAEVAYVDDALLEVSASLGAYFSGDTASTPDLAHAWTGTANASSSTETAYAVDGSIPSAETPTAETLISTDVTDHKNDYNFGFFYCFTNEVGDSAFSQVTIVRAQRSWSAWRWELPNAAGEPNGTATSDPTQAADQLVAIMPESVFDQAVASRALSWSLYMITWSNQDAVPVQAVKVAEKSLTETPTYESDGWAAMTPLSNAFQDVTVVPSEGTRYNYSDPSKGGQGLVAADRMIMVKDPTDPAMIKWSSNLQGDYSDFTAGKGGGYKTLTSGNLFIPAAVKLWQNPQSVDTLTILCAGTDGHSTGYYMAPAQVASQSDATNIMGFEETTATPGTTSPYGCEVFNNTLFHPLDDQLMKSTASNYNINHKSLTDQIENMWVKLRDKDWIISSQLDKRLYFIVHNPAGELLEPECKGNELWVFDAEAEAGTWSRWLIQATSLRKIEFGGKVYMSVVKGDGIYYLDPDSETDDIIVEDEPMKRYIPWRIETNTQGANRAHDAWARLQQLQLSLGNFQGSLRYGIRSWDMHGQPVDKNKIVRDLNPPDEINHLPFDLDDSLEIQRDLQQWFFYAGSIDEDAPEEEVDLGLPPRRTVRSFGQINSVQYRYVPVSVNVGYEYGSIETFEYQRATVNWNSRTTDSGVPQPMTDVRRP